MTTTTTTSATTAFDEAVHAALKEAAQSRSFGIVHAASRRGFAPATAVLSELFKLAVKQNDTGLLKALHAAHYPGALVALNSTERAKGMAQTPAPGTDINAQMVRDGALQEADKQFQALARKHFIGDALGLERVAAVQAFNAQLARRDQRRVELAGTNAAASWAV